jgi:hypothetical protein
MRRASIYIVVLILISIVTLIGIKHFQDRQPLNSFNRNFLKIRIDLLNFHELSDNHYTFVNQTAKSISIRNYSDRLNIYDISYDLNIIDTLELKYPHGFLDKRANVSFDVLNNDIYLMNSLGILHILKYGKSLSFNHPNIHVDKLQAVDSNTIIVRNTTKSIDNTILEISKLSIKEKIPLIKKYFLPKTKDAFFANDGYLHYDKTTNQIFYMYFYKGFVTCLDTNLNLRYISKTIDTVRNVNIVTKELELDINGNSVKKSLMTKPPSFVNYYITTHNKYFYILPRLRADNEDKINSSTKEVIDVYNTNDGKYSYSFYVPKYRNLNLREFLITDKLMFAFFGKYIVSYRIKDGSVN